MKVPRTIEPIVASPRVLSMSNERARAFGFQPEMSMNRWFEGVCEPSEDDLASRSGD